jgi:hypothetical protein
MAAIRTLRPNLRTRCTAASAIGAILLTSLPTSSAYAQRGRIAQQAGANASQAVAGAVTGIITDTMTGIVMGPFIVICQIAEVFNDITVEILKVPASQAEKLLSINADMAAKLAAFKELPLKERREKMLAALPALEKEYIARFNEHLDAEQRVVFRNLLLNIHGPTTFAESDVATALALTEAQRAKVAETLADSEKRLQDAISVNREFGALDIASVLSIRKKRDAGLLAVLTPEQQEAWTKLKGPPPLDVDAVIKKLAAQQLTRLLNKPKSDPSEAEKPATDPPPSAPASPAAPPEQSPTKPR